MQSWAIAAPADRHSKGIEHAQASAVEFTPSPVLGRVARAGPAVAGVAGRSRERAGRRTTRPAASVASPQLQGEVWVYDDEQGEWQGAQHNRPFTQGDRLSTAAGAQVRVAHRLDHAASGRRCRTRCRAPGRRASAVCPAARQPGAARALARGRCRTRGADAARAVSCPCAAGCTASTGRTTPALPASGAANCSFMLPNWLRTLQAGQRAEFWREGPQRVARYAVAGPAGRRVRAGRAAATTRPTTRSAAPLFVSPEMTGVEDLDRHGGWQQHPEYGAVWTPTQVVVGWAPYRHGQWVWQRPWGWTWVDDAPWGFAPFHYGRWLSWGGRWCWAPGPRVARPVYAPALVAWVGGPQYSGRGRLAAGTGGGLGAAGAARGLSARLPRQPRLPGSPEHAPAACGGAAAGSWQPRRSGRRDRAADVASGAAEARGGCRIARRRDGVAAPMAGRALSPRCPGTAGLPGARCGAATRGRAAEPGARSPRRAAAGRATPARAARADAVGAGSGACRHAAANAACRAAGVTAAADAARAARAGVALGSTDAGCSGD